MLAALEPALLERLWFPLGERTKAETRTQALAAGLTAASRPESQEECFLGGDDYRAFLERSGLDTTEGQIGYIAVKVAELYLKPLPTVNLVGFKRFRPLVL